MKHNRRLLQKAVLTILVLSFGLFQACCTGTTYQSRLIPVREIHERIEADLPIMPDMKDECLDFVEADARVKLGGVLDLFDSSDAANLTVVTFDSSSAVRGLLGTKPVSIDIVNSCDEYEPDENTRRAYEVGQYVLIFMIEETEYPDDGGLIPDNDRIFSRLIIQKSFSGTGQK